MHHKIPNKRKSSLFEPLRHFLRERCFCIRNFISALTKNMCLTKEELTEINQRVKNTQEGDEKFRQWERVAPVVKIGIQELKEEVHTLRELNQLYTSGIIELYIAEQNNDTQAKADIFSRFGLPHILK